MKIFSVGSLKWKQISTNGYFGIIRGLSQKKCTCWQHCVNNDAICPAISTGELLEASAVYFVSVGVCTWKRQSVEMAAVSVSGTVTNDDQRAYIKIETLRGKTPKEIHSSLMEVCGVETVDRCTISRCAQRFRKGRLSMENDPKSGRPRTSTDEQSVERVLQILEEDRRMTLKKLHILLEFCEHLPAAF